MNTRSRQGSKRAKEPAFYVLAIDGWDWGFSFGINDDRLPVRRGDAYNDYRHLEVQGELTRPQSMIGRKASLSFVPTTNLREEAKRYAAKPENVGTVDLSRRTKILEGILSMPEDVLSTLLPVLLASRFRFLLLQGTSLFRGSASIRSYSFSQSIGYDDLPAEEPLQERRGLRVK